MPIRYFKLDSAGEPVETTSDDASEWWETHREERQIADTQIDLPGDPGSSETEGIRISTVFLFLDHQFDPDGPPLIFETMVFGGVFDRDQERYSTRAEALAGHEEMVARVREGLGS